MTDPGRQRPGENATAFVIDAAVGLTVEWRGIFPFYCARISHSGQFVLRPPHVKLGAGVLIYVHGYNERAETAQGYGRNNIAAGYRESGGTCDVGTFLWNSRFGALQFGRSIRAADATAPVFADAMKALRSHHPGLRIHVIAHSLGARMVMKAVQENGLRLQDVALVSPAIGRRSLESDGEFGDVPSRVERILCTCNPSDRCLRWYPLWHGRPLGRLGFRRRARLPANILIEDMERAWRPHSNDGGHGAILHPQYWKVFWELALARGLFR